MSKKSWFTIKALGADDKPVETNAAKKVVISVHDEIGAWGVNARDFIAAFKSIPADAQIELSVHSIGGSCYDALAMYHVMVGAKDRITARVEGVALSAASMIIMAAGRVEMPTNAYLMVHNPACGWFGDYKEMEATADLLKKLQASFATIYCAKSGKSEADVIAMMDAETWMTGDEAVAQGFADATTDAVVATAKLSEDAQRRFGKVPKALSEQPAPAPTPAPTNSNPPAPAPAVPTPEAMPADQVATACAEAGYATLAAPLIRLKADKTTVEARLATAREITALSAAAGRPGDAADLIAAGTSVDDARAALIAARASAAPAITSSAPAEPSNPTQADPKADLEKRINFNTIYASRKAANNPA